MSFIPPLEVVSHFTILTALGCLVKTVYDWFKSETHQIIRTHVKSGHKRSLNTCQEGECSNLQMLVQTELLEQV